MPEANSVNNSTHSLKLSLLIFLFSLIIDAIASNEYFDACGCVAVALNNVNTLTHGFFPLKIINYIKLKSFKKNGINA